MSSNGQKENTEASEKVEPKINALSQYIRDLSFENFAAREKSPPKSAPEISVQVNLDARKIEESFEVVLKLKVDAKAEETNIFLLELEYAGVFNVVGVPDEHLHPVLMVECPRILFPFARRIIRDTTTDGGFPPLNVDTIDFLSLYKAEIARRSEEQKKSEEKVN